MQRRSKPEKLAKGEVNEKQRTKGQRKLTNNKREATEGVERGQSHDD
jgi:hypothetical protein